MAAGLPFAPGASPFKSKGVLYLGALEYLDRNVRGGRKAVLESLADPELVRFLEQPFVVGGWYDAFPSMPLQQAASNLAGLPLAEFVKRIARWQAERDTHGVYRVLLKLSSPHMVMDRVPVLATKYFDFVKVDQRKVGPRAYESEITGVPLGLAPLYTAVAEPFLAVALETAGARHVRFTWEAPEPHGHRAGVPLVKLRRSARWE